MSETEHVLLIEELNRSGALNMTKDLAMNYLKSSLEYLRPVVNIECMENVKPLNDSIQDSLERVLISNTL